MSNVGDAPQLQTMVAGTTRNIAVSFAAQLDSGELLTGTPTIVEVTSTDLTLASKAVSSAILTILGESVASAAAVTFSVTGASAGGGQTSGEFTGYYKIKCTATTDATVAQTLSVNVYVRAV
ncbi:hypothetical protein LCGC14_0878500 [marine sediment metagenome]|uniref:Uncharacterized protein n=1 Tax=marine sediment metagenome TaxID=412755 RepID=A0A0F9P7G5_9ZZZZ|nr:hypothetical protein [Phycisphaerae bacterium]